MSAEKELIADRIYIGNLDFKATEDELKQFFEDLTVTDIDIPSKVLKLGKKVVNKHLGFAFIQFETKEQADEAIEKFNGKEFKGRKIYVKKAVPPPTEEEKQKKNELFKAKRAEQLAAKKAKQSAKAKTKKEDAGANGTAEETPDETVEAGEKTANEATEAETKKPEPKVPDGKPSKDTVFITNLDYKADYKILNNMFKPLKPKWIHVPQRKVPYHIFKRQTAKGRPIFNKGIAFVKFADEESQLKAIEEFNGKEINGRNIIIDIAVDARVPKEEDATPAE